MLAAMTDASDLPKVDSIDDARTWVHVMHRRTCADATHIADLYERTSWLSQPWWRRAFRRPPWLR